MTGESYTHAALIDMDEKGDLAVREATSKGSEHYTGLSDYGNRRYKILGNASSVTPFKKGENGFGLLGARTGTYNLVETNCTSQVTRWTGMRYVNNPGVLARRMGVGYYLMY